MNRGLVGLLVAGVALSLPACGDDDDAAPTSSGPPTTVIVESTLAPPTTLAPATTDRVTSVAPTTSAAPPTTVGEEALKSQISADYLRSWDLRRALIASPALEGLDEKLAQISVPGSGDFENLRQFVTDLVADGERAVPGTPDLFSLEVERVDLEGAAEAVITVCIITNGVRVNTAGDVVADFGLTASRSEDHVAATANGWLPDGDFEDLWQGLGVTECPPA